MTGPGDLPDGLPAPLLIRLGRRAAALAAGPARPALFLDRDGVVIEDRSYLSAPEGVCLIEGAAAAIATAAAMGAVVVLVSNQSGVGRGYFPWSSVTAVDDAMATALRAAHPGAEIDITLYAGAAPDGHGRTDPYRKPAPGMISVAGRLAAIDPGRSILIGDRASDIEAAIAGEVGAAILVGTALPGSGPGQLDSVPTPSEAFRRALEMLRPACRETAA